MKNYLLAATLCVVEMLVLGTPVCSADGLTTINLQGVNDGQKVWLIDTDTDSVIDTLIVNNETVTFSGNKYNPAVVRIAIDNTTYGTFLLNDSPITLDIKLEEIEGGYRRTWQARGGYNDSIDQIRLKYAEIKNNVADQPRDIGNKVVQEFLTNHIADNADNIFGYQLLLMSESELPLETIESLLDKYPSLKKYQKVNSVLERKRITRETRPGNIFKDFTITHNGIHHNLSDIVGKGDYVLIDFWAHWCAPCRAEMPYIKNVFDRYKDRNFKVIGVAISDNPEKDLKAATDLGLPWEVWVNGYEASRAYSIKSIPHLILFGPDGTILEQGIRGDNILPTVSKYLN